MNGPFRPEAAASCDRNGCGARRIRIKAKYWGRNAIRPLSDRASFRAENLTALEFLFDDICVGRTPFPQKLKSPPRFASAIVP